MTFIRVVNQTRGTLLGSRVRLADDMASRVRGFLFRPPPAAGEGILLSPCKAVHMYGVRFPLDVVFISEQGQVVATYRDLAPWRRSAMHGSALHALELPAGSIRASGTLVGDVLSWTAAAEDQDVVDVVELPARDRAVRTPPPRGTIPAPAPAAAPDGVVEPASPPHRRQAREGRA
jgi:uncharacterized protein